MIPPGLFVTGTDTEVGKTTVASAIARSWARAGHPVGVLKPVASGGLRRDGVLISADAESLIEAIGRPIPPDRVAPMVFEEPLAPPVAARRAGDFLTFDQLEARTREALDWWSDRADALIVEGVGGLLCPIAEARTVADLAISIDYPLLIVADRGLGALNRALLTVESATDRGLRVAGVVLNGARPPTDPVAEATNARELARRLRGVAILADFGHGQPVGRESIAPEAGDWYDLARPPRFTADPTPASWPGAVAESCPGRS